MDNQGARTQEFRLALLYNLISALEDAGKTQIQKLVYFLQEAFGLPTKYTFRMHHYGPYSEELDTDMTRLKLTGYVSISPDPEGYGYHVSPADEPERGWRALTTRYSGQIKQVLELFGDRLASELELAATIHFVEHLLNNPTQGQLIQAVESLKPKFDRQYIIDMHSQLRNVGLLGK